MAKLPHVDTAEPASPETTGDWKEICSRLLTVSDGAVSDLDLLVAALLAPRHAVNARRLAKTLLARFGSFAGVIAPRPAQVADAAEVPQVLDFFGLVRAAGSRLAREEVSGAGRGQLLGDKDLNAPRYRNPQGRRPVVQ